MAGRLYLLEEARCFLANNRISNRSRAYGDDLITDPPFPDNLRQLRNLEKLVLPLLICLQPEKIRKQDDPFPRLRM